MDEEIRQFMFLIVGCVLAMIGSTANYLWMKHQKGEDPTMKGLSKASLFGAIAGILIWLANDGGNAIYHMVYMSMCFTAGVTAETLIGKAIGSYSAKKEVEATLIKAVVKPKKKKKVEK